jgi:hypothetical protein
MCESGEGVVIILVEGGREGVGWNGMMGRAWVKAWDGGILWLDDGGGKSQGRRIALRA